MANTHLSALGALLLLGSCLSFQEPASKPSKQESLVKVATLNATTRAPSKKEVEELGLKLEVRVRGQVVSDVAKDGACAHAGIEPGDVLVKLDANDIYSQDDIADFLSVSKPDQKVKAVVLRAKTAKENTVSVSLGTEQVDAPENPRLAWEFASLGQLGNALAKAKTEKKLVLVGLSGAET